MTSQHAKQEFIGGILASVIAKKGVEFVVEKALDKVAKKSSTDMTKADVPKAAPVVVEELKDEVQARAEHQLDAEPHWQSRNIWGVIFGLMGEAAVLYKFSTDGIPQNFQTEWAPHIMVIIGLLTPLYSRFIAKKPLFR